MIYNAYRDNLLDRPSMTDGDRCVICGRFANDKHHVIPKGMGGVPAQLERRIPKLLLCGNGNASGCHGLVHQKLLHLNYTDAMGWCFFISKAPMDDELAWKTHRREFRPVKHQRLTTFGKRS